MRQRISRHPKGCPNFNKKEICPPKVGLFDKEFDIEQPIFAIWNIFDLGARVANLKSKHPGWSDRQLCLYWQPKARKQLSEKIKIFEQEHPDYTVNRCPEAMGVDITSIMKSIGISLEWPLEKLVYQIALAGKN